jgi:hypothetical protein
MCGAVFPLPYTPLWLAYGKLDFFYFEHRKLDEVMDSKCETPPLESLRTGNL